MEAYPELEYEYFIHGDMCIAHGAQCYSSGVFFGKSGNRGLCMKPCRWGYQLEDETVYPMAVKDMSLYQHIPELILSGVNSYKIEGRMRGSDYLIQLIDLYGEAIDRSLPPTVKHLYVEAGRYAKNLFQRYGNLLIAYRYKFVLSSFRSRLCISLFSAATLYLVPTIESACYFANFDRS